MCFVTMATSSGVAAEWFLWQQEAPTALLSTSCLYSEPSPGTAVAMRRITLVLAYRQTHKYSKTLSILLRENRKAKTQVNEITLTHTHIAVFKTELTTIMVFNSIQLELKCLYNETGALCRTSDSTFNE